MAFFPTFIVLFFVSRRRGFLAWILGFSLILMPLIAPALKPFIKRATYTFQEGGLDESSQLRVDSALRIISKDWLQYPFLGAGVTGRGFIDGQYFRVLAETGGLGLLSFLWILFRIYGMAIRTYRESPHHFDQAVSLGFLSGFVGLLFHALTTNTFIVVRIMEPFWCLAGIVAMLNYLNIQEKAEVEDDLKLEARQNSLAPPVVVSRRT